MKAKSGTKYTVDVFNFHTNDVTLLIFQPSYLKCPAINTLSRSNASFVASIFSKDGQHSRNQFDPVCLFLLLISNREVNSLCFGNLMILTNKNNSRTY